jgi:hypothetical protein
MPLLSRSVLRPNLSTGRVTAVFQRRNKSARLLGSFPMAQTCLLLQIGRALWPVRVCVNYRI